jgi:hypothetical protein
MDKQPVDLDRIAEAYGKVVRVIGRISGWRIIQMLEKMRDRKSYYSIPEDEFYEADLWSVQNGLKQFEELEISNGERQELNGKVAEVLDRLIDELRERKKHYPPKDPLDEPDAV